MFDLVRGKGLRLAAVLVFVMLLGMYSLALAVEPGERDYWPTKAWEISCPSLEGMDEAQLLKALSYIVKNGLDIRSLLVVRNGYLVFENYYALGMPDRAKTVHSVTKSIMSTLIGLAHHQKILPDLDAPLSQLLPAYFESGQHREKAGITLWQLLTMTAGYQPVTTRNYSHLVKWYLSPDRVSFTLNLPQLHEPGKKFAYCNATSHLLSVILTDKAGIDLEEYAQKNLFDPLGIKPFFWQRDAKGYTTGNGGLQLTARQMAKLGFLFLNKGVWDGKQVVPEKWLEQATRAQVKAGTRYDYGYQWWIRPAGGHPSYRAWGHGGQFIVVVPDLDLVIVTTAETKVPGKPSGNFSALFDIIAKSVIKP